MVIVGIIVLSIGCIVFFLYKAGNVKGNGIIETLEMEISGFNSIILNGRTTVNIHKSNENKISLTIDNNLIKHVSLEVKKNILTIEQKKCFGIIFTEFVVDIYTQNINNFTINGSGNINLIDNIFNPTINSTIIVNGSGFFDGKNFETENAVIKINGSGKASIAAGKNINAEINGSGHIIYYGNPEIKSKITGKGKIELK
ncbi:MAG: DUF2807 domain-containing protein [Tannerellaceae bacterium]|nr:DUF2807 domain-containing protein [Tannerellaceae bacterium]